MPKPATSMMGAAPRASAWSAASSTSTPAPSPITRPERSRENGRHASGLSTRSASHPFMKPGAMEASQPPVMATSTTPARIMCAAWPIAWLADAQAEATQKHGPWMPNSIEMWLAGAFGMIRGTVNGCSRDRPWP